MVLAHALMIDTYTKYCEIMYTNPRHKRSLFQKVVFEGIGICGFKI